MYSLVAEHEDFLVVDKHPEVSMHNEQLASSDGSTDNAHHKEVGLIQQLRLDFNTPHIYPVHRLDKPTSGLLICAKTAEANSQLSQLFQNKQVEKYYLALSNHKPKKKQGLIAGDMERTRNGNWKLTTTSNRPAITQFFSYGLGEGKRLFILKPYTGKTHQLRVALKSVGAPIKGDIRYSSAKDRSDRTCLHAYCLRFRYADKDYHFQSLPSGDDFNSGFIEYVIANLNEPWKLSWPALPKKYLSVHSIKKTQKNKKNDNALVDAIQCIIDITSEPLSEYQLIKILNQQGWDLSINSVDSLRLFTSHFLVFNALYRLQVDYWKKQQRYLAISALSIFLHPKIENNDGGTSNSLTGYAADTELRDYYLDTSQLEAASEESVNAMLNQFWEHYIATDESSEALQFFSLEHPTTQKEIKQRYRTLAMEHHPDRGGKPEIFQKVNWAFGVLQRVYK